MSEVNEIERVLRSTVKVLLVLLALAIAGMIALLWQTPIGAVWRQLFAALFGLGTTQTFWYATRAAGLAGFLLLWLSTVWGLGVSSKIFDRLVPRAFTYDVHEFLSVLALGFVALHVIVLLWDGYLPFSVTQLFVPFLAPYRPVWVAFGILGLYLTLLVTVTFYIRRQISIGAFRVIHVLSLVAYVFVAVHSWFAGTDTPLALTQLMYTSTSLVVVLLTVYWFAVRAGSAASNEVPNTFEKARTVNEPAGGRETVPAPSDVLELEPLYERKVRTE